MQFCLFHFSIFGKDLGRVRDELAMTDEDRQDQVSPGARSMELVNETSKVAKAMT